MKMNMKQWAQQLIADQKIAAVPIMTHPGIDMTGKRVLDAVSNGNVHFEAIKALADHYPTAAATVIMDLTVEAEAFGAEIAFDDDVVPAVIGHLLNNAEDIRQLQVPPLNKARIPAYLKANLLAAKAISDRPVLAGCIGPFSLAGRLYDMSAIMMLIYEDPETAELLLDKCTQFILKYCLALKATGANGVVMAEPAAGLMSDDDCMRFSSVFVRRIVDAVQDDYFTVVLHNCGNTGHCTHAMVATGAQAFHFGNKCDMEQVTRDVPPHLLSMGNIDPVSMFKDATPQQMYEATTALLQRMTPYPNFVISSGCDTPPHAPIANIDAFFKAVADWNKKRP